MRHIVFSELNNLFSFKINSQTELDLYEIIDQYTKLQIDKPLKTLDFLNTVIE